MWWWCACACVKKGCYPHHSSACMHARAPVRQRGREQSHGVCSRTAVQRQKLPRHCPTHRARPGPPARTARHACTRLSSEGSLENRGPCMQGRTGGADGRGQGRGGASDCTVGMAGGARAEGASDSTVGMAGGFQGAVATLCGSSNNVSKLKRRQTRWQWHTCRTQN